MSIIYRAHQYFNSLPATGRLFYACLSYLLDLIILLYIVEALEGGQKWEVIAVLVVSLAYTMSLEKLWHWIEGGAA